MIEIITSLMALVPKDFLILFEIGVMIVFAGVFAFIFKVLKQPRIPAYIVAGIILGPLLLGIVSNSEFIIVLSEIGVAFLLFFAGLEINFRSLKKVGGVAAFSGIIQMIVIATIAVGTLVAIGLGNVEIIYGVLVVAFSSTMVVIKLLADKNQLGTLHGRIIIGILLIQDIVAILALTILTTNLSYEGIAIAIIKAVLFAIFAFVLAKLSTPLFRISAKSSELLLLVSLAFLFVFSISAYLLGLSLVIGSFFAGVALANSTFKTEIRSRVHSLRDFFGAILFVSLGMQLVWIPREYLLLFGSLLIITLFIKPIILMITVRLFGYTNRTSFFSGNYMGQSSEFALIILTQGLLLSQIGPGLFSALVFVVIITMSLTGYFTQYEHSLYGIFSQPARLFSRISTRKENLLYKSKKNKKVVLFGAHRMGTLILKNIIKKKEEILVIDYNPEIISALIQKKIPCLYGDYGNPEIISEVGFLNPETVISTIPNKEDNLQIISKLKKINKKITILVVAERIGDAIELYKKGADYVILPKVISGEKMFKLFKEGRGKIKRLKKEELKFLNNIHHFLYGE